MSLPVVSGGTVVLGYVADSATQTALSGALIVLRAVDRGAVDTTTAYSDSAGGFAIRIRTRGRYQYSVLAQNFALTRDSIDLRRDAETVRVAMRRGLPLCDVQVGR
jgi:3-hydroxy-3-methylglutaryl CoA synthase